MSRSYKKNPSFNPFTSEVRKAAHRRANKKYVGKSFKDYIAVIMDTIVKYLLIGMLNG